LVELASQVNWAFTIAAGGLHAACGFLLLGVAASPVTRIASLE
jgi:hypothetical protein